jgi:hypothetical protein
MITNIIKNNEGQTVQFTDTCDNCITKIENYMHKHFCANCNTSTDEMKFIKETGYYDRTVTMQCKCGNIVKYHG